MSQIIQTRCSGADPMFPELVEGTPAPRPSLRLRSGQALSSGNVPPSGRAPVCTDQRGAVAVFIAILLPVLFGMGGLVIDLGRGWENQRELQNCADGAALAAAQLLPDQLMAEAEAEAYLQTYDNDRCLRGGGGDSYSVDVYDNDGDGSLNAVRVTLGRAMRTFLAGILGATDLQVNVRAAAIKGRVRGMQEVVPFAIVPCTGPNEATDCPFNTGPMCPNVNLTDLWIRNWDPITSTATLQKVAYNQKYTLKMGGGQAEDIQNLNIFGPNGFEYDVTWGTKTWVSICDKLPDAGGMKGPTESGVLARIARDVPHPGSGQALYDRVMNELPPNSDHADLWDCPRVVVVPVVTYGKSELQVVTFAVMFLEGSANGYVTGWLWDPQASLGPPRAWRTLGTLNPSDRMITGVKLIQ